MLMPGARSSLSRRTSSGSFCFSALALTRESGAFPNAHEAFWAASRWVNGDADGTREHIDVLLLHRSMNSGDIQAWITAALRVGAVSADVVAAEATTYSSASSSTGGEPL